MQVGRNVNPVILGNVPSVEHSGVIRLAAGRSHREVTGNEFAGFYQKKGNVTETEEGFAELP